MKKPWIILDCNQLAWASFHTTGGLSYRNVPTGVSYGFLGQVLRLEGDLDSNQFVFCFDYGRCKRYDLCNTYKANRKKKRETDEHAQSVFADVCRQLDLLRTKYLPQIGYRNVLAQKGYEADDLIASICNNLQPDERAIIVSSDKDLYQCLRRQVSIYTPKDKKILTAKWFRSTFGIPPRRWVKMKCLAGCTSDNVPGIKGVGEVSALKYLRGELDKSSVYYRRIRQGIKNGIIQTNMPLVCLPMAGTKVARLRRTPKKLDWKPTLNELGIKTLATVDGVRYEE